MPKGIRKISGHSSDLEQCIEDISNKQYGEEVHKGVFM